MPWISPKEAKKWNIITKLPNDHWMYLYDMMTERFIYIGRPVSPTFIEDELQN